MKTKSLLLAIVALISVSTLIAQNQVVSFYFAGAGVSGSDTYLMGVVPAGFFNRVSRTQTSDKTDAKGWAYVAGTNINTGDVYIKVAPTTTNNLQAKTATGSTTDPNNMLFTSGLYRTDGNTPNAVQAILTMNSTYAQNGYDLYAYYRNPTSGRTNWVKYSIPGSDVFFSAASGIYPNPFKRSIASVASDVTIDANYAKFESLTSTSLTLTIEDQLSTEVNTGLCGLQLVEKVPAPIATAIKDGTDLVLNWSAVTKRQGMNATDVSYIVNIYTKVGSVITKLVTDAPTTDVSYRLPNAPSGAIYYTVQSKDTYTQSLLKENSISITTALSTNFTTVPYCNRKGNVLTISKLMAGSMISVTDLQGRNLYKGIANSEKVDISCKGFVIVSVDGKVINKSIL